MKSKIISGFVLVLLFVLLSPSPNIEAASSISIKTKIYTYKGQQYVQIIGGDKKVSEKINKTLKLHAVTAAKENAKLKKNQKYYYHSTTAKTKYVSNQQLSVVFEDSHYDGGAHGNEVSTSYNFDLKTGKQLYLNDVAQTNQQKYNLFDGIEAGIKLNKKAYPDVFQGFPLTKTTSFYFYKDGVVILFNPYEVGPYAAGFIEVKVPFKKINVASDMPMFNLTKTTVTTLSKGTIPGFKGVQLEQTKAEVTRILNTTTKESYYETGGLFWILTGIDHASFNFDESNNLDRLRNVYLSSKAFPMKTFKDVEQILGKAERYESSIYLGDTMIHYTLGNISLEFSTDSNDETETVSEIMISKR
ncbi:DUF3298 and DUF4163 domain-containing protein [Paenibacillus sp. FSL K6-2862]|uniref:DUF3298 and DUF4163 domain-containing protein n=1 Tax=Paenibacillus sp. FSL K6-2862 TaxID=2921484 RepID=UPI0030F97733